MPGLYLKALFTFSQMFAMKGLKYLVGCFFEELIYWSSLSLLLIDDSETL